MIVVCGGLRLFWHIRPMFSGATGRRDVGEIEVLLKCEAKWVQQRISHTNSNGWYASLREINTFN